MKLRFAVLGVVCSLAVVVDAAVRWEPYELPKGSPAQLRAQLGRLTVPLRRVFQQGERASRPLDATRPAETAGPPSAEIVFVRLQIGTGSVASPIVYLDGGPGGSGAAAAKSREALVSFARLAEVGDVILLDQRGTGMSTPRVVCSPPAPLAPEEKFGDPAAMLARMERGTRACVEEWTAKGVDVAGFTNRESAADLEDLRKALGVPKISLLGFSYGTHLALAAMRDHGRGIDRVVLVGTEGPNHTRKLPSTLDTQLAKLSRLAGQDMTEQLRRVLAKLEQQPMMVTVEDRQQKKEVQVAIGPDALRRILLRDIGDGNDFTIFPALLSTIDRDDASILRWFVQKRYSQVTGGVDLMVVGMECSSSATADRERQIRTEAQASPFRNAMNFPYPEICAAFPPVDLGDAFRGPLVSDVPVLFVSGTLDSNTPPFQAEELRWGMPNATHLIVANAGHEDTLPNPEVRSAIRDFLAGSDVSARRVSLPAPKFRSVEEARKERR